MSSLLQPFHKNANLEAVKVKIQSSRQSQENPLIGEESLLRSEFLLRMTGAPEGLEFHWIKKISPTFPKVIMN